MKLIDVMMQIKSDSYGVTLEKKCLLYGSIRDYHGNIAYDASRTIDGNDILQMLENKTHYVDDNTSTP